MQTSERINDMFKYANVGNNGAREVEFDTLVLRVWPTPRSGATGYPKVAKMIHLMAEMVMVQQEMTASACRLMLRLPESG